MTDDKKDNQDLCGWGPFHPKWLQRFHNPVCLAASLMFTKIIHGIMMAGFIPASVTQWSKKFGFKNTEIATINNSFEIASIVGLVVVAHYGNLGHKGRWLGIGIIVYAIGSLLYCIPQWLSDPYEFAGAEGISMGPPPPGPPGMGPKMPSKFCEITTGNDTTCKTLMEPDLESAADYAFYIFVFASILRGIGSSPLFVLGTTYLDENVSQVRSPKFLGFMMFGAGVGPLGGAVFAAMCLKIYGDIGKNIDLTKVLEQINSDDPRWYGAWWIGYLAVGIFGFLFAIPILGFARKLPTADEERKHDVSQEFASSGSNKAATGLMGVPMAVVNLFRNYCYVILCLAHVCMAMGFSGLMLFGPKLVEDLFNVNSSEALLISTLTGIIPASIGMAVGGMLISKLKLKVKQIIRYSAVCLLIATPLMAITMLHCDPLPIPGVVSIDYHNNSLIPGASKMLTEACNADCTCGKTGFQPVCDKTTGLTYYSPCHAGCTTPVTSGKAIARKWNNCSCLSLLDPTKKHTDAPSDLNRKSIVVESGLCPTKCWRLYLFAALMTVKGGVMGMTLPAFQQSQLRIVGIDQRTLGLSVTWILSRVLGTIPGQQIMGAIVDSACEFDGIQPAPDPTCPSNPVARPGGPPRKLKCVRYNSRKLAVTVSIYGVILNLISVFFYLLASWMYKSANATDTKKEKEKMKSNKVIPMDDIEKKHVEL